MSVTREAFRTQRVKIQPRQSLEKFKFNNKPAHILQIWELHIVETLVTLYFWTIVVPIFDSLINVVKNISSFPEKFVIFFWVTDFHFL